MNKVHPTENQIRKQAQNALAHLAFTQNERVIIQALLNLADRWSGDIYVSCLLWTKLTHLDYRTVNRALKKLFWWNIITTRKRAWRKNGHRTEINSYRINPPELWRLPREKRNWCETITEMPRTQVLAARLRVCLQGIAAGDHMDLAFKDITVGDICETLRRVSGTVITPQKMGLMLRSMGLETRTITGGYKALSVDHIRSFVESQALQKTRVESCKKSAGINSIYLNTLEEFEVINNPKEPIKPNIAPPSTLKVLEGGKKKPLNKTLEGKNTLPQEIHEIKTVLKWLTPKSSAYQTLKNIIKLKTKESRTTNGIPNANTS